MDNDITGLGEGYLPVFAPKVFTEILRVIEPYLVGMDADPMDQCYRMACRVCDYWSFQGAARHVISAIMIALVDAVAKAHSVPSYKILGRESASPFTLYGSGGDSPDPKSMSREIDQLTRLGIVLFKIRARKEQVTKTVWTMKNAARSGIRVGVDMTQNLARPSQTPEDILAFVESVHESGLGHLSFLEEIFGPEAISHYPEFRKRIDVPVTGGEIVTTAEELLERLDQGFYDWVQPDATVVGGPLEVLRVFDRASARGTETVVHCWGGGVCQMANYHCAWAAGAGMAEWPMPAYPLREGLLAQQLDIRNGQLHPVDTPGLGVQLTPEIEEEFPFREDAIYSCLPVFQPDPDPAIWSS